jgi:hypothetical protein
MQETHKKLQWKIILKWFFGILGCAIVLYILSAVLFGLPYVEGEAKRAEARSIVSQMATACGAFFKEDGNTNRCTIQNLQSADIYPPQAPVSCMQTTNFFWYSIKDLGDSKVSFIATRCTQGGHKPSGRKPYHISLTVDYKCGTNFECCKWQHDYDKFSEGWPI